MVSQHPSKRTIACKTCGNTFLVWGPGKCSHCSDIRSTRDGTDQHARHVSTNRLHVRAYSLEGERRVWGMCDRSIAGAAESIAAWEALPQMGFSEVYHLSTLNGFFPFDMAATFQDERVSVEVTTGAGESLWRQRGMADALGMKSFVPSVKPDSRSYHLAAVDSDNQAHHEDGLQEIA